MAVTRHKLRASMVCILAWVPGCVLTFCERVACAELRRMWLSEQDLILQQRGLPCLKQLHG